MSGSNRDRRVSIQDGYQPATEGYRPGVQIEKGYRTAAVTPQPPPPRGGSGVARPSTTTTAQKPKE